MGKGLFNSLINGYNRDIADWWYLNSEGFSLDAVKGCLNAEVTPRGVLKTQVTVFS